MIMHNTFALLFILFRMSYIFKSDKNVKLVGWPLFRTYQNLSKYQAISLHSTSYAFCKAETVGMLLSVLPGPYENDTCGLYYKKF
jgi:hypothetical protein